MLAADARPASVARAFAAAGFRETYVADLDAIGGAPPAWSIYRELIRSGLELWVDAGVATGEAARELAAFECDGRPLAIVAGLETLDGPGELAALGALCGWQRLIFSLDLKQGAPLFTSTAWRGLDARQIATVALRAGVRRMIVLDLARVGMGTGAGTEPLCRDLRALSDELEIIGGGGVRSRADLSALAAAGCDGALVASALHDGRIEATERL